MIGVNNEKKSAKEGASLADFFSIVTVWLLRFLYLLFKMEDI
jgi:hypothetical protein